jgi:hypothetical protein
MYVIKDEMEMKICKFLQIFLSKWSDPDPVQLLDPDPIWPKSSERGSTTLYPLLSLFVLRTYFPISAKQRQKSS